MEDIFEAVSKEQAPLPEQRERLPEIQKEAAPEKTAEQPRETIAEDEGSRQKYVSPSAAAPVAPVIAKSSELVKIESILSENLDELFLHMTPEQQLVFQQKGEETATKIERLMTGVKLKVRELLGLIREWLQLIPGINKFFLEQEAKIKTDRLINLHEQRYKQK